MVWFRPTCPHGQATTVNTIMNSWLNWLKEMHQFGISSCIVHKNWSILKDTLQFSVYFFNGEKKFDKCQQN